MTVMHVRTRCGSPSLSPLANECIARVTVSFVITRLGSEVINVIVNHFSVVYEILNVCEDLKIPIKICFENVNINK